VLVRRPSLGGLGQVVEAEPLAAQLSALRTAFAAQFQFDESSGGGGVASPKGGAVSSAQAYADALAYFDAVAAVVLLPTATATAPTAAAAAAAAPAVAPASLGAYAAAFARFAAVLGNFGYSATAPEKLADRNFCLSMLDQLQPMRAPSSAPVAAVTVAAAEAVAPPVPAIAEAAAAPAAAPRELAPWEQWAQGVEAAWKQLLNPRAASSGSSSGQSGPPSDSPEGGAPEAAGQAAAQLPFFAGLDRKDSPSATRALNGLANRVLRCLLYGSDADQASLAAAWPAGAAAFRQRYGSKSASGGASEPLSDGASEPLSDGASEPLSDADKFYAALGDLLGPAGLRAGTVAASSGLPLVSLKDTYAGGLQRVTAALVASLGTPELGRGTRTDLQALSDFALWVNETQPTLNPTNELWSRVKCFSIRGKKRLVSSGARYFSRSTPTPHLCVVCVFFCWLI
jgi:hypothetical protein